MKHHAITKHHRHLFTAVLATVLFLGALPVIAADAPAATVNINTADEGQLSLLPKVGPALAQRIIEFREANGNFKAAEELMLVRGIGDKTFEQMKPWVAVSGETTLDAKVSLPRQEKASDS